MNRTDDVEEPLVLIISSLMDKAGITEFTLTHNEAVAIQGGLETSSDITNGTITFRRTGKDAAK